MKNEFTWQDMLVSVLLSMIILTSFAVIAEVVSRYQMQLVLQRCAQANAITVGGKDFVCRK